MPKKLKQHIAICNWSSRGDTIIRELRKSQAAAEKEIIVLTEVDVDEKELRRKNDYYKSVFFIANDPTSHKALEDARIHYAESVIILATNGNQNPDPLSILTCLAISKICTKLKINKPHIIAELMDRENRELALDAGADEIVSAGYYRTGIMLQSALYPNLSDIFHELLTYGENKTSTFIVPGVDLPKSILGITFNEVADKINNLRSSQHLMIPIGVKRNKKVILNPQADNINQTENYFDYFKEGDGLVVLSDKIPNLTKLKF